MGRRMKLSQLDEQECQWVLGVIHRDFELRHKEQQRLSKIERELNEAANQRNLLAKRKEFNEKCCILCCATFNLLFNKRLLCTQCQLYVCRNCATWESHEKKWLCRVCEQQRVLYVQSCEWFYDHIKQRFKHFGSAKVLDTLRRKRKESGVDSENDSGYGAASDRPSLKSSPLSYLLPLHTSEKSTPHPDDNAPAQPAGHSNGEEEEEDLEELSEVRRHIETVVQGLIGENLDTARVDKPYSHPQYHQLFSSFHSHLVDAITKLCQALDIALNNKPDKKSTPLSSTNSAGNEVTPTTAHAALKQAILDVAQQAASLPVLTPESTPEEKPNGSEFMTSCLFHSYQELLASAIINKLVEQSQKRFSPNQRLLREDSEVSENSDTDIRMNSVSKDGVCSDQSGAGSETESLGTESSLGATDTADDEFLWADGIKEQNLPPNIKYVLEERIEEITKEEITDSDGNHQRDDERVQRHRSATRQKSVDDPVVRTTFDIPSGNVVPDLDFLNAWDIVESRRVPFPEFGVDIVEEGYWDENGFYYDGAQDEEDVEEEEFDNVGSRRSSVTAWEENWLFRKRKLLPYGSMRHQLLGFYGEPPCMLIPNPRDGPSSHPQIGSRDVDQLSELSEQNSVGSLDFTDSESESEFQGSQKLVELAQNVAHHFNSRNLNSGPYQTVSETLVTRNLDPEPRILVEPRIQVEPVRVTRRQEIPPVKVDECLPVPKFVSPCQRTTASHDPYFVIAPEGTCIHAGKVASFQCQVKGTKPFGVAWYKGEHPLQVNDRLEIFHREKDYRYFLNIYDTEVKDSGSYSCVVFGRKSENWADFNLQVKGTSRNTLLPEFVVPLRMSERGEYDRSVQLTCTLSGYPEPRLLLFHNKQPVVHSSKHTIECLGYGEWRLKIHGTDSSDEGEYEAYASNRLGHALSVLRLTLGDTAVPKVEPKISRPAENTKEVKNTEVNFNEKPNRFLLEPLERRPLNGPMDLSPPSPAPCDLSCPPRPGTIAEREHRKWEKAVPLANNPYSSENQSKRRLERRVSDVSLTTPAMTYEEFERQRDLEDNGLSLTTQRYHRDYYVNDQDSSCNSSLSRGSRRNSDLLSNGLRENTLDAIQTRVYESADKVSSLEGQVRLLERELEMASGPSHLDQIQSQVVRAAAQVDNSSRQVSRVENEVRRLRKTLSSESERSSQSDVLPSHRITGLTSEEEGEETCALPSVKHLANLFTPAATGLSNNATDNHSLNGIHTSKSTHPEREVVIVESGRLSAAALPSSSSASARASPVQQQAAQTQPKYKVHSLTARSLSKEFRQQVARHVPRPMNRTVSVASPSSSCSSSQPTSLDTERSASPLNTTTYNSTSHLTLTPATPSPLTAEPNHCRHPCDGGVLGGGYTSDESSASNTSLPRSTKRRPISKAIMQRANYWERRAEQGLLSDNSVCEEFPIVRED